MMNWSAATRLSSMTVLIGSSFALAADAVAAGTAPPRSSLDPGGSLKPGIGLDCCSTLTLLISIGSATLRSGKLTSRISDARRGCQHHPRPILWAQTKRTVPSTRERPHRSTEEGEARCPDDVPGSSDRSALRMSTARLALGRAPSRCQYAQRIVARSSRRVPSGSRS